MRTRRKRTLDTKMNATRINIYHRDTETQRRSLFFSVPLCLCGGSCFRAVVVALAMCGGAFAACATDKQPKTEQALIALEQRWAKALEQHDADVVGCLLAPEFMDSDPDGALHDRATLLSAIPARPAGSNRLDELKAVINGDAGVVHGINHVLDAAGHERARVRFT